MEYSIQLNAAKQPTEEREGICKHRIWGQL